MWIFKSKAQREAEREAEREQREALLSAEIAQNEAERARCDAEWEYKRNTHSFGVWYGLSNAEVKSHFPHLHDDVFSLTKAQFLKKYPPYMKLEYEYVGYVVPADEILLCASLRIYKNDLANLPIS